MSFTKTVTKKRHFLKKGNIVGVFSIHNCKTLKETEGTNKNFISVQKVIFFDRDFLINS